MTAHGRARHLAHRDDPPRPGRTRPDPRLALAVDWAGIAVLTGWLIGAAVLAWRAQPLT